MNRIRSFKDLEFECNLIERNSATSKMKITSAQVLDCIAQGIESSILYNPENQSSFLQKIWDKFFLKKLAENESWNTAWKSPKIPKQKNDEADEKTSLLRLRTAITAFKLHSGPFSRHPAFGILDKNVWESIHLKVADYFLEQLEVDGRNKHPRPSNNTNIEKTGQPHYHQKKKRYSNNKKKFKGGKP
jgi:hypothetical protein